MIPRKVPSILFVLIFSECLPFVNCITLTGDDPWYKKASFYWPFDSLQDNSIVDQRGSTSVPARNKNGLHLDGSVGSWADLGNCSTVCINNPGACEKGFTVTLWLKITKRKQDGIVLQIGANKVAVGTTLYIKNDALSLYVNTRTKQRHVEVKWPYSRWVYVALVWNRTKDRADILLDCKKVNYTKSSVRNNDLFSKIPPYNTLILGASNARVDSINMTVDDLALWNDVISPEDIYYISKAKAVDGNYTDWTKFSSCTTTCGKGTQNRSRTCTNPRPQHGGNPCKGNSSETTRCFLRHCPIDGNYSDWTEFSSCSFSCGGGKRYRNRTCTRPRPQYGGMNCSILGPSTEAKDCNTHHCPIHGRYGEWSNFSRCSVSCGSGKQTRRRNCDNPKPQYGGRDCTTFGPAIELRSCFIKVCPVDGNFGNWSNFSVCSTTCGGGQRRRTRKCDNPPPRGDGRNCSRLGKAIDIQPCNTQPCPVDGSYSPWSEFSRCTKSCGSGSRYRTRSCTHPPPEEGGQDCKRLGPPEERISCNTKHCPIDGGYGEWSQYGACSQTCGTGQQRRTRACDGPHPQHGGKNCSHLGASLESIACNTQRCPDISFIATVKFPEEEFHTDIFNKKSTFFQRLKDKITYNVRKIYDENSALNSVEVKFCGDDGGPVVRCVLEFGFLAARYAGILSLQDALTQEEMIHKLPVQCYYISSNDVPSHTPENVRAQNSSSRSIMVTWKALRDHTPKGGEILGYRVQYTSEDERTWSLLVTGKDKTRVELRKLEIYTLYCVRVMGYNVRGYGLGSPSVCAYTDADVPDGSPLNVMARNISSTELFVSWEHVPSKLVRGVLLGYQLKYREEKTNDTQLVSIPPNEESHHLIGLKKYTSYIINVAAVNEIGVGVDSDDITGLTDEDVPSQAPNITQIFYTSSTSLYLSWEPLPKGYVHGRLLGYRVFYIAHEGRNDNGWETVVVNASTLEVTVSNLGKFVEYIVQVVGFTTKGDGRLSKSLSLKTDEDVPSQPPQNVTIAKDNSTSTSLFIHWRPVPKGHRNGIIRGYRILYKKSGTEEPLITKNVSAQTTATILRNLAKYTEYDVTVLAHTSKGNGAHATFFTVSTTEDRPSEPPTLTKVLNTSSTSIRVIWKPIPSQFIHGVLQGYVVLYRAVNKSEDTYRDRRVGSNKTTVELTKLWKYTKYEIRVLGFTRVGWGIISPEVEIQTDEDTPSWPPENVTAINKTSPTTIPVSWQPISDKYYVHGILQGYTVTYRAVRNPNQLLKEKESTIIVGPRTLSVKIRDLSSFTVYIVQVRAFTRKGNGTASFSIFAETCNCYSVLHTSWWLNPPYMDKQHGNVSGIFPPILKLAVSSCCGECAEHGNTKIDYRASGGNESAIKSTATQVKEAIDDGTELSFPIYGRMEQTDYLNEYGFAPLVQSAGVAFIIPGDAPGAAALMVVKAVFELWPLILTVFVSAFFAGTIMWLMDFLFNAQEFPSSPLRGPAEGMWWAFVTMTTLGYGDRVPRGPHSKVFAIAWIICGLVITALVMSFITTSLTMDIIQSDATVYGSKVAAIDESSEFRLGIRMNARMDRERKYTTLADLYKSLNQRLVDGALIDAYTVGRRKDLFSDGVLRMGKVIDYPSAYGVVMAGYARKLQKCFREFLKEERAAVFEIITNNVEGITGLQDDNAADKTEDLFDAESSVYVQTVAWCGGAIAVLTVILIVYELLTRSKRDPNPRRYDYSDYLEYKSQQDMFYDYKNTKKTMKKILKDFRNNCRLRLDNLKTKHRRELRLLARLKQEAGEKGESEPLNGTGQSSFQLRFPGQNRFMRYINGIFP